MLRLFPALPSSDKLTPASSLVARNNDSNMRIVAGSTTLPEGNIVYPISFTLTSFTTPTPTCHCSNSTSYDVTVAVSYESQYRDDEGDWHDGSYSYSQTIAAGASFDDNGFTDQSEGTVTSKKITITIQRPHAFSMVHENLIARN